MYPEVQVVDDGEEHEDERYGEELEEDVLPFYGDHSNVAKALRHRPKRHYPVDFLSRVPVEHLKQQDDIDASPQELDRVAASNHDAAQPEMFFC